MNSIQKRVQEAGSYRGKVISLESVPDYAGKVGSIRVHKLAPVPREQVILPVRTLELLERNVTGFANQRDGLRSLGLSTKKGLLFYGPPGTGKTHTIRYLARQLPGHTTLLITAEQVGLLDWYFQLARHLQPAVIVIEDVDLIGRAREEMDGICEESMLNKLLNEMDGLREDADVFFILTTNRPEHLEAALASRPGRVDQAIEFPLPDGEGRRKLIQLYARGLKISDRLTSTLVRKTSGVSAAFIKELMRRSAQYYLTAGRDGELAESDVDQAIDEMLFAGGTLNKKLLGAAGDGATQD
jgi:ATP-dependent 26S proteasome regulatory subunit